MKPSRRLHSLLAAVVLCAFAPASQAVTITQNLSGPLPATVTGTLPDQSSVLLENFTLPTASNVDIRTTSYASGGFQTNLFLFNPMGVAVAAGVPFGAPDPATMIVGDTRLTANNLPAGMYTLALTDFLLNQSLTATNLSAGFTSNFGNGTTFVDANGNTRSGAYSVTINATAANTRPNDAAIPEPATVWLAAPVLAWVGLRAKKMSQSR